MNKVTQCYNCGMPRFHGVAETVPQPADVYRIAVDTGLVCAHIGVTNLEDDYETARKKLNDLICWNIQVDRDLDREHVKGLVEALEAFDAAAKESTTIIGFSGKALKLLTNAREALATYKAQEGK